MKTKWLDRYGSIALPHICLCLTLEEYKRAIAPMGQYLSADQEWCEFGGARMHMFENADGQQVCVVCIYPEAIARPAQIAGMLVHEAVHVVQYYMKGIGEKQPSDEFQAYTTQWVSQILIEEYARRIQENTK